MKSFPTHIDLLKKKECRINAFVCTCYVSFSFFLGGRGGTVPFSAAGWVADSGKKHIGIAVSRIHASFPTLSQY